METGRVEFLMERVLFLLAVEFPFWMEREGVWNCTTFSPGLIYRVWRGIVSVQVQLECFCGGASEATGGTFRPCLCLYSIESIPISVLKIGQVVIVTPTYGFLRKCVNFC